MFGQIGMSELLVILVIVLLVFGPKKIPELARGISRGLNEFKRAAEDVKQELQIDYDRPERPRARPPAPTQQKPQDSNVA
ncbi:twin-arginine translocase TatA/TatE family subunit [candidate division KSB1 bacterium]|nr:twin-arginine translocase TatA/TatE family subunit [candidate division KSB1 bacterium]